jgi:hypothetical protein
MRPAVLTALIVISSDELCFTYGVAFFRHYSHHMHYTPGNRGNREGGKSCCDVTLLICARGAWTYSNSAGTGSSSDVHSCETAAIWQW